MPLERQNSQTICKYYIYVAPRLKIWVSGFMTLGMTGAGEPARCRGLDRQKTGVGSGVCWAVITRIEGTRTDDAERKTMVDHGEAIAHQTRQMLWRTMGASGLHENAF